MVFKETDMEKAKEPLKKSDFKEGKERFKRVRDQKPSREELLKNFGITEEKPKEQPDKKSAIPSEADL